MQKEAKPGIKPKVVLLCISSPVAAVTNYHKLINLTQFPCLINLEVTSLKMGFTGLKIKTSEEVCGTSLSIQLLRHGASAAGAADSIPGWGTKILHAAKHSLKKKKSHVPSEGPGGEPIIWGFSAS